MDPSATLNDARVALESRDYAEARLLLASYWDWRNAGGFEPKLGDQLARSMARAIWIAAGNP